MSKLNKDETFIENEEEREKEKEITGKRKKVTRVVHENDIERKRRRKDRKHRASKRKKKKKSKKYSSSSESESDSDSDSSSDHGKRRGRRKKKKKSKRYSSSSESDSDSDSSSDHGKRRKSKKNLIVNERLMKKLADRGETLEEREMRRAQRRAARITAKFGYSAEDNPFNDPNLHEAFTWKKREEKSKSNESLEKDTKSRQVNQDHIFGEIEKVRKRRKDREIQFEELERIRAEENRMKELENYDEWARKEEEFHLQQQRQRSAIRLVEGREKPIDVMAKNLLMFGLTDEERKNRAAVKYQEKYNVMSELHNLEAELERPQDFLKNLRLGELEELAGDVETFRRLESDANRGLFSEESTILRYWNDVLTVVYEEIRFLKEGGESSSYASTNKEIQKLFTAQSEAELSKMKKDIQERIRKTAHMSVMSSEGTDDVNYWKTVLEQLNVHVAKSQLSAMHNKMLIRQLEQLEQKREELETADTNNEPNTTEDEKDEDANDPEPSDNNPPDDFNGTSIEEELGLTDEVDMKGNTYVWQDKFRPRKPRYFHRVKSGYDWNTYNKTHYDHDNPPPKIVQGYRFNVFYPDLIDKTKTPQFYLEPTESNEFCIIRFSGGPPYEDIAFKIINREWNRSRKHGFKSTFERGILTLYFNFTTHWYRR